ncbi:calmodulin-lysine N-methyltransferase-like isoform X1 [Euwallacea similis]|uniref:calmodulin-lysine N-methyltransferase-like isoform X1 n=2 Tax=Euwallacea similis TaxID=1736056 RepID=UPI00344F8176
MDQSKDILDLSRNFKIDLDQLPYIGKSNEKKKVARRRWAILAKALKSPSGSQPSSPTDEISVRRISSFMLLETRELPGPPTNHVTDQISKRTWFEYSITIEQRVFKLNIGHRNRTFSAEDLMGFNNTGNVCIWPSEETLSYYVCLNLHVFTNKSVLELGGGMSCLAGLLVAKNSAARDVLVTDGNKTSMENVEAILQCNSFSCNTDCAVLKWGEPDRSYNKFDVIISADCLFFDDARLDFINCLCHYLAPKGLALVMAPQRGSTLDNFILQSEARGLICKKIMNYSEVVWKKRLSLLDSNCDYNDNIHYPILIEVTKP